MTHHLSEQDVRAIASYAHIGLDEEEIARMTLDLNAIIDGLDPITHYDLDGIEPTYHPFGCPVNVMREDVPAPGFTQGQALANAPAEEGGSFSIPAILAKGGERA